MPGKIVAWAVGVFMALAGPLVIAYAGYWWAMDRPAWHVGWCPFCIGWTDGARAQLAKDAADLNADQASINALMAAISLQNTRIAALSDEGTRARVQAETAVTRYQRAAARASSAQGQIAAALASVRTAPVCRQYEAVHRRFTETLP